MTLTYRLSWLAFRGFARIWFRSVIANPERVPLTGPVILASNHASFADPPLVGSSLPREISYLARDTLFHKPLLGWYIRQLNAVPVNREGGGGPGLKAILDRLNSGGGIVLFPEGTRTPDGNLLPAKSGIGLIVAKSTAPVVPVRLGGTYEAWGRHRAWPKLGRVRIQFGEPMHFEALRAELKTAEKARVKAIYQEIADQIMARIATV
jgi:1-acyl-sn-glycerol-3-phosphate acyltransferase